MILALCDKEVHIAHMTAGDASKSSGRCRAVGGQGVSGTDFGTGASGKRTSVASAAVEEARRAGLLDGERTEHVSFRAPRALIEAARRETGIQSKTELGIAAFASLASPDPVAAFMKRTRGRLAGLPKIEP